jgi:ubiquinone/menaquinone biosynthesis C-methylase UbiE
MRNDGGWQSQQSIDAWRRAASRRARYLAATTDRLLARARVGEGARVLDLGTGTGELAILLAERVGAGGHVVATDKSPAMVHAAEEAVRAKGLGNVAVRIMDAAEIDLDAASFDAVVGRMFLMFVADVGGVLNGARRVLRPGGRFVATTWAAPERNPFQRILLEAARARGRTPPGVSELERAFSLHDRDWLAEALERAGFANVAVERIGGTRVHESLQEALEVHQEGPGRQLLSAMSEGEREETLCVVGHAYATFATGDGRLAFPMETLVSSGTAPNA